MTTKVMARRQLEATNPVASRRLPKRRLGFRRRRDAGCESRGSGGVLNAAEVRVRGEHGGDVVLETEAETTRVTSGTHSSAARAKAKVEMGWRRKS